MATATWVREELDRNGVAFEELHHPEAYTAQELAQKEHISGHRVAKVVCVMADNRPIEVVLPATRRIDLDRLAELVNAREARLASEEEMSRCFTDCEVGAIPALRHWGNVDVIMDAYMSPGRDIVIMGGTHCDAFRMSFDDWFRMVNPRVEALSEE